MKIKIGELFAAGVSQKPPLASIVTGKLPKEKEDAGLAPRLEDFFKLLIPAGKPGL